MDTFFITINRKKGIILYLIVLSVLTLLFLDTVPLRAQWGNPPGAAGTTDAPPPLNDSTDHQEKTGALSVNGFTGDRAGGGDAVVEGGVGVGSDFVSSYLVDISAGDNTHGIRFSDGTVATTSVYNEPTGSKGGYLHRNSSINFGSDWSAVMMGGVYNSGNPDQASAHANIGKRADASWGATMHCAGLTEQFIVDGTQRCTSGTPAGICAQKVNNELIVSTGGSCRLSYTVFK